MKKLIQLSPLVLVLAFIISACNLGQNPANLSPIHPTIVGLSAQKVVLQWEPVKDVDHVEVSWKSLDGKYSGKIITKENKIAIEPKAAGTILTYTITPYIGEKALASTDITTGMYSVTSTDTILINDEIIMRTVAMPNANVLTNWCQLTFDPCTVVTDNCGKTSFNLGTPGTEAFYKVVVRGVDNTGTVADISFIIHVATDGKIEYVTKQQLNCLTLSSTDLCTIGRITTFDNGGTAFNLWASSSRSGERVIIQGITRVTSVSIAKAGGCSEPTPQ